MDKKIKIVIPAKGKSARVPNKNLKEFHKGKSLLEICIEKCKELGLPIAVNSEDKDILELAKIMGVEAQKRPKELSKSTTQPSELAKHIAEVNSDYDYIYYIHCTNPLIEIENLKIPLQVLCWKDFDSINSAYFLQKHVWDGRTPLYNVEKRPNTQEIKNLTCLEYSFNLVPTEVLAKGDFIGSNPAFVYIPEEQVCDIDTEKDWDIAKVLYDKKFNK